MAYQSLYRRYRPRRFSDVRDQEEVVRALRNAVREDRVGHAYLFSGPRGTGKTSTARILAKALNCVNLQDGEPDGVCDSCLAIDNGTSYDVQELDAASNNKVEEVRELISRVALGSPGRTKVYILDEVHMLTAAASAALLKTLEEPPDHVVFVLATTDPQKVLPTIRSRTQHYEFRLLGADDLTEHVQWVIHDAGLDLGPDAVEYVVRQGGGSARDTLSALERVAAAGGVVNSGEALTDLLDAVAAGDPGRALLAVSDAVSSGRDPRVLGEALLSRLRDVFLQRMGAPLDHLPPAEQERVQVWADQLGDRATTRALEAVGDALLEMRQAPDPRIPLEVALVKLSRVDGDTSVDALAARVAKLEAALAAGVPSAAPGPAPAAAPAAPAPA
ncbi:MAG: dnaX, partial [Ilumatobacteraceae bacterium]|nr:dnaX [Ilumatobacteraceae bacterium]